MPWGFFGPFTWTNRQKTHRVTFFGFWLLIPTAISLLNYRQSHNIHGSAPSDELEATEEWTDASFPRVDQAGDSSKML